MFAYCAYNSEQSKIQIHNISVGTCAIGLHELRQEIFPDSKSVWRS